MGGDESVRSRANGELRSESERLLRAIDELRALEREKHRQQIAGLPFDELAERVDAKAREVFRLASEEPGGGRTAAPEDEGPAARGELDEPER